MTTWLVSYADAAFQTAAERLARSAERYGIDRLRLWGREMLERTSFYQMHRAILDRTRGGGNWLWKPFIVGETLREMAPGDLLVYSDAGIEIVADLAPLFDICRDRATIMLFGSHYDDIGAPGPSICAKWTKRDCFVLMGCDEPWYYATPTVDASFMVLSKTDRVDAFIADWRVKCEDPRIFTDDANVCGLPNLPTFIAHLFDQSVLSLIARRERVELFRHPSEHGNHLKEERFRQPGEFTRHPYGAKGIWHNSPYGTLLHHHRGVLGQKDLVVDLRRTVLAPRARLFESWTDPRVVERWSPLGRSVLAVDSDVRVGGRYQIVVTGDPGPPLRIEGTYFEVEPPARLVYSGPGQTEVRVEFHERAGETEIALRHGPFTSEKAREFFAVAWRHFFDTVAAELE